MAVADFIFDACSHQSVGFVGPLSASVSPPARGVCGREEAVDVARVSWRDHREITRADGEILRSTRAFVYVAGC